MNSSEVFLNDGNFDGINIKNHHKRTFHYMILDMNISINREEYF